MKVLVTGAAGFLGRSVVTALRRRGHEVRALVRPATEAGRLPRDPQVEVVRADLRAAPPAVLAGALDGIEVVVHLAAAVSGSEEAQLATTVVGTERLLDAMVAAGVRRLVLASTFSVYDWPRVRGVVDEETPLNHQEIAAQNGYAIAKYWQETLCRRRAREGELELTVLRPGYIWGPGGHELVLGAGLRVGRWLAVIGPLRRLPMTHVESCADAFAAACDPRAAGETFNVVDEAPRAWTYARAHARRTGERLLPVPYALAYGVALAAKLTSRLLFGPRGKLPTLLTPCRFQQMFKPARFPNDRLARVLGWRPPFGLSAAMDRTFGPPPGPPGAPDDARPAREDADRPALALAAPERGP